MRNCSLATFFISLYVRAKPKKLAAGLFVALVALYMRVKQKKLAVGLFVALASGRSYRRPSPC